MEGRSSNDNVCVVCFRNINIYAIGTCDHYDRVCFICSARLRVLCQKNECPICRKVLPRVIFSRQKQPFSVLSRQTYSFQDHKHHISFEDEDVEEEYRVLQQHQCPLCPQINVYQSFGHLKDHVRKIHERFYCELCVENLKQFTFERKHYSRKELAQHRRTGDTDDTSHRGHPRCQFCDTRYLDKDELFRHLRRDHFYCHFCDADGSYQFYGDYELLRSHFQDEHFLCQEGSCKDEKFTSAFRSDMELKMHIAAQHSKNYSKQQQKQARTLELEFTITPRSQFDDFDEGSRRGASRKGPRGGGGGPRGRYRYEEDTQTTAREIPEIERQVSYDIDSNSAVEFPSLGNDSNSNQSNLPLRRPPPRNYREFNCMDEESFPSLGGGGGSGANASLRLEIYNKDKNQVNGKGPNLSIKVSSRSNPKQENNTLAASVLASAKPKPQIQTNTSSGWFGEGFAPTSMDFPTLVTQPTKKSTLSWIPKTAPATNNNNNAWMKNGSKEGVKKQAEDEFTLVVSKDKKKKQKSNVNQNLTNKAKTPEDEPSMAEKIQKKVNSKKEPSPVKEIPLKPEIVTKPSTFTKLKPSNHVGLPIDDFPPLASESKSKTIVVPPGFITPTPPKKKPVNEPPPGFKKPEENGVATNNNGSLKTSANFTLSSLARQLSVSNNKPEPVISPSKFFSNRKEYIEPENFQNRNRELIEEVMNVLERDEVKFGEFKKYSGEFRKGLIPAKDYYQKCVTIFGYEKFCKILSELLVLLPDIPKQQELLNVHNEFNSSKKRDNSFLICASCQQVLSNFDFRTHVVSHDNVTFVT